MLANRYASALALLLLSSALHAASQSESAPVVTILQAAGAIDISPESLVATGIAESTGSAGQSVLSNIEQAANEQQDWAATKLAMDDAGTNVTVLAGALKTSPNSEPLQAQYESALAHLANTKEAFTTAQQALLDAAFDGVVTEVEQSQVFAVWRANASRSAPREFRVLDLSETEWHGIERALRAERRSLRKNEPLDTASAQLLADVRSDVTVIQAKSRLEAHLSAVSTTFEQFLSD